MTLNDMFPGYTQQVLAAVTEACDLNEQKSAVLAELECDSSYREWPDIQLTHALLMSRANSREIETTLDGLSFALAIEGGKSSALEAAISIMEEALTVQRRFMALLETEIEERHRV